jgi:hydrogenase maturation protease
MTEALVPRGLHHERGHTLVGAVGYRFLRDHSAAMVALDRLAAEDWPDGVVIEDASYGPIALVPRLEEGGFRRAILLGAVARPGRAPGTVTVYRWDGVLPGRDDIQAAVTEAVTGVISLDNALVITRHFRALPEDAIVIEIEPETEAFGEELTPRVEEAVGRACALVRALVLGARDPARLPRSPIGGHQPEEGPASLSP